MNTDKPNNVGVRHIFSSGYQNARPQELSTNPHTSLTAEKMLLRESTVRRTAQLLPSASSALCLSDWLRRTDRRNPPRSPRFSAEQTRGTRVADGATRSQGYGNSDSIGAVLPFLGGGGSLSDQWSARRPTDVYEKPGRASSSRSSIAPARNHRTGWKRKGDSPERRL